MAPKAAPTGRSPIGFGYYLFVPPPNSGSLEAR